MSIMIFGHGQMGSVIRDILRSRGAAVTSVDKPQLCFENYISADCSSEREITKAINRVKPRCIISSLPYFLNEKVYMAANESAIPYIDLGGSVPVSATIKSVVPTAPTLTDMGLAPGLVNMWAEDLFRSAICANYGVQSVSMMVGGIPSHKSYGDEILNYNPTWSIDGLLNEYVDDCEVLFNGNIIKVPGMSGWEDLEGGLEAFYTSGGAATTLESMKKRGVQHCSYKTIRYDGHRNMVSCLLNAGKDVARKYIESTKQKAMDDVHIKCRVTCTNGDVLSREKTIRSTEAYSAMQIATATPVAIAAIVLSNTSATTVRRHIDYEDFYNLAPGFSEEVDKVITSLGGYE